MKSAKLALIISAATIGLLSTTASALALAAVAKSAVNVRTGPSVNFTRVDTLHAGEQVNVTECQNGWCYVQHSGPDGWVSGNYLQNTRSAPVTTPSRPNVNFGVTVGPGGPSFSFSIGSGYGYSHPVRVAPKVCFYNGRNYTGARFCVNSGQQNNRLGGFWNNKISSIQVQPGASVTVCRNRYYRGLCQTYNSNVRVLTPFLNNKVSSFKTH